MAIDPSVGAPNDFDVGDRVVAMADIGGFFRARVRRNTPGVVVALAPGGQLAVNFGGSITEMVSVNQVAHRPPPA